MSKLSATRRLVWAFSVVALLAALPGVCGGGAYLRRIGPPPLRFAAAKPMQTYVPASFAIPVVDASTNSVEAIVPVPETSPAIETKVVASSPIETNTVAPPEKVEFAPAENLLTISPTMLSEYFKPVPGMTNNQTGVTVVLPVEMGFKPPSPSDVPSSRATYKTE